MTGHEAWSIVAPLIAHHMKHDDKMDVLDSAYILVFHALKEYDEREEKNELHCERRS